jgi:hypothetical protein
MNNLNSHSRFAAIVLVTLLVTLCGGMAAYGQITPSGDAYTNTATPTTNLGTKPLLDVESASQTTYIQFDLSSIPSGYTSASIAKATLKLYVNAVTTAGSFNVDYVNGTWSEKTITADLAPALGTTIVSSVPLTSANVHDYIIIDITPALTAWLDGTQTNDGIALVGNSPLNASFDSKENTANSQPAELDIVFAGGGTITGVTTASGSGLTGGGTSGTLNLGLTKSCAANQVLQWNGSSWVCAAVGTGTITGVTPGPGLLGGGTSGNVPVNLDTTKIPELATANTFSGNQTVNGNLAVVNNGSYQPFSVQSSSTFGTWMTLGNTSAGGHTWSIISAGGSNAEGAGNFGLTDFTGKSTIWLEGNVNAGSLMTGSTAINNMGCSGNFGGIGFGPNGSKGCANYSLLGEGVNTYLNRPTGGAIAFRESNTPEMTLASGGFLGIGTTAPRSILEASVYAPAALGPALTLTNSGAGHTGAASALDFNSYAPSSSGTYNPAARIAAVDANNYSNDIVFSSNQPGAANNGLQEHMRITSAGGVSINGDTPMSHNPHMSFSTTFEGSLCGGWVTCGYGTGSQWGGFVPDYNIVLTRIAATLNSAIDPSCNAYITVSDTTAGQILGTIGLSHNVKTFDSGPESIPAPAGHFITVVPGTVGGSCNYGTSAGGDVYMNTQYVMR